MVFATFKMPDLQLNILHTVLEAVLHYMSPGHFTLLGSYYNGNESWPASMPFSPSVCHVQQYGFFIPTNKLLDFEAYLRRYHCDDSRPEAYNPTSTTSPLQHPPSAGLSASSALTGLPTCKGGKTQESSNTLQQLFAATPTHKFGLQASKPASSPPQFVHPRSVKQPIKIESSPEFEDIGPAPFASIVLSALPERISSTQASQTICSLLVDHFCCILVVCFPLLSLF